MTYGSNGVLVIRDMTAADQGEYDCIATNVAGQGSNTAVLNYIGNNEQSYFMMLKIYLWLNIIHVPRMQKLCVTPDNYLVKVSNVG